VKFYQQTPLTTRFLLPLVLSALTLSGVAACRSASNINSTANTTATIGMLLPLGSETGTQARKGAELAVRHLNNNSGQSIRFEARWEDERGEPTAAGTRTEALAADSKVLGVVGPINSGPAIAAADVANRQHLVLISPLASTPTLAKPHDYFFRTWTSDAAEAQFESTYARDQLRVSQILILHVGAAYGQDLARAFAADFKSRGGTIVDTIEYPPDTQSFSPIINRVIARSPQAVYFVGYPPDTAEVLRELRSRRVAFPILAAAIISDPSVSSLAGANAEGVMFPFPATFDPSGTSAAMKKFADDYKKAYNEDPGFIAAQAYDATMILAQAINTARGNRSTLPTREEVEKALDSIERYDGATGTFVFDENGDAVRTFRMYEIREGRMTPRDAGRAAAAGSGAK
jgi:branched-chain amino acid transport system substrate-binding protein